MTTADLLGLEVERCWLALIEMSPKGQRTIFLTSCKRLISGFIAQHSMTNVEVGTYTRAISLAEFREDVEYAYEQLRRKSAGSRR